MVRHHRMVLDPLSLRTIFFGKKNRARWRSKQLDEVLRILLRKLWLEIIYHVTCTRLLDSRDEIRELLNDTTSTATTIPNGLFLTLIRAPRYHRQWLIWNHQESQKKVGQFSTFFSSHSCVLLTPVADICAQGAQF